MLSISAIVATDTHFGIGVNNTIPWNIPADLNRFKEITTGHRVVMGRATWNSLPAANRPLPNRKNIVLSKTLPESSDYTLYRSLEELLKEEKKDTRTVLYVIGGESIYTLFKEYVQRVYVTRVFKEYNCDRFFPISMLQPLEMTACSQTFMSGGTDMFRYEEYSRVGAFNKEAEL